MSGPHQRSGSALALATRISPRACGALADGTDRAIPASASERASSRDGAGPDGSAHPTSYAFNTHIRPKILLIVAHLENNLAQGDACTAQNFLRENITAASGSPASTIFSSARRQEGHTLAVLVSKRYTDFRNREA